jgi:hypothetical protein
VKKLRLGIFFAFVLVVVIALLFLYLELSHQSDTENISSSEEQTPGDRPFTLTLNKKSYSSGEPIEITINRNNYPSQSQDYLSLTGCNIEFTRVELDRITDDPRESGQERSSLRALMEGKNSRECQDYFKNLGKEISTIGRNDSKTIIWNQQSCEMGILAPAIPDDYTVEVSCGISDQRGSFWEGIVYSDISTTAKFKIEQPPACLSKQIRIIGAQYNQTKDKVMVQITNSGNNDVENIGVILHVCNYHGSKTSNTVREVFSGIKKGETRTYSVQPNFCTFEEVTAHVYECYDRDFNTWSRAIIQN